jgi:hypothetical protein
VISSQVLHANGGGYFRGGVERAGDLAGFEPHATQNIRMVDEKLTIKLGPQAADVEIRYLMRNETDKKVKVRFGFPVEESFDKDLMGGPAGGKAPDGKRLAYCRDYQIRASGKAVKAAWQGEVGDSRDPRFKGVAGWLVSEITFAARQEMPLLIRFQSAYPQEEWNVSDDQSRSPALFRYRLSTAACWNGSIGMGSITIEAAGIDPAGIRVLKPVNRFRKDGGRWVWNFENLEPSLADDLEIEARPAERIHGSRGENGDKADYIQRGETWSMLHANYQVKASSTLKPDGEIRYAAENIRNHWESTVWSEGAPGPGTGEWLEITPTVPKPLLGIQLKPGYQKDGLFKKNARPKRIRIELNGEHRFDAEIPDKQGEIMIPVTGYAKPVRKLRITFTEVYPGSQFEDLCITSVRLHVRLTRKPDIQPAR